MSAGALALARTASAFATRKVAGAIASDCVAAAVTSGLAWSVGGGSAACDVVMAAARLESAAADLEDAVRAASEAGAAPSPDEEAWLTSVTARCMASAQALSDVLSSLARDGACCRPLRRARAATDMMCQDMRAAIKACSEGGAGRC